MRVNASEQDVQIAILKHAIREVKTKGVDNDFDVSGSLRCRAPVYFFLSCENLQVCQSLLAMRSIQVAPAAVCIEAHVNSKPLHIPHT